MRSKKIHVTEKFGFLLRLVAKFWVQDWPNYVIFFCFRIKCRSLSVSSGVERDHSTADATDYFMLFGGDRPAGTFTKCSAALVGPLTLRTARFAFGPVFSSSFNPIASAATTLLSTVWPRFLSGPSCRLQSGTVMFLARPQFTKALCNTCRQLSWPPLYRVIK